MLSPDKFFKVCSAAGQNNRWPFGNKIALVICIFVLVFIASGFVRDANGNFGVVIPGQLYRSGQLSAGQLQQVIDQYKIKSIFNLRGHDNNAQWYLQEKKIAVHSGVKFINADTLRIGLQSLRLPAKAELQRIVKVISTAPRPILVHCRKGADRTGLVSSLAILLLPDSTIEQAWEHSSLKYFAIQDSVGRLFLEAYQDWLTGRKHDRSLLMHWVDRVYVPHYYLAGISPVDPPEVIRIGKPEKLKVRVVNESREVIPLRSSTKKGVLLGAHFYKLDNELLTRHQVYQSNNADFDLMPGDETVLKFELPAVTERGDYVLSFDLFDEFAWFSAKGSPIATINFRVRD